MDLRGNGQWHIDTEFQEYSTGNFLYVKNDNEDSQCHSSDTSFTSFGWSSYEHGSQGSPLGNETRLSHNELPTNFSLEGFKPTFSKLNPADHPDILVLKENYSRRQLKVEQIRIQQQMLIQDTLSMGVNSHNFNQIETIFLSLNTALNEEKAFISHDLMKLNRILSSEILSPWSINSIWVLRNALFIMDQQLSVYLTELTSIIRENNPYKCFYRLVILNQPFPETFTKNKVIQLDSLTVGLLPPTVPQNAAFGPVVCRVANDSSQSSEQKIFINETQPIDFLTNSASFPLKLTQGTRRATVHVLFALQISITDSKGTKSSHLIESEISNPFVVITNESQWDATEEVLFKWDLFDKYQEISYSYFCNVLQRHFILVTKQDLSHPKRSLSLDDFDYIYEHYFKNVSRIKLQHVTTFWSWFGKTLKELKYQRYIKELWQNGLLYGCLQRKLVDCILQGQPNGTFIIRFSERHAGQFGIAYVKNDRIKHYLVMPKDIAGAKKTLSDFLSDHTQFLYILRLTYSQEGYPVFCRQTKKDSLEKYYSSSAKEIVGEDGYDPLDDM